MSHSNLDTYRKAVLNSGISGRDWQKIDAFDEFTRFFDATYSEEQRQSMKYDAILKVSEAWWQEHRSRYS